MFYLDGGGLVGALTSGRAADLDLARGLIASGEDVADRLEALETVDGNL